jgi:hypothetical protein
MIFDEIDKLRDEMTETLIELIRTPAIGPENGGEGSSRFAERSALTEYRRSTFKTNEFHPKSDQT